MAIEDLSGSDRERTLAFLLAVGDDEFLHGERVRQWLTVAPTLEEDNVLTSIAQDEMGHARLWYELVTQHRGTGIDELAIFRRAADRRNSTLVERDHADFADTVIRSHIYDRAEAILLEALSGGDHDELVSRAEVASEEETFHREHVDRWLAVFRVIDREEDRERIRGAVRSNLRYAGDLFAFEDTDRLVEAGVLATSPEELEREWREAVLPPLADLPIDLDEDALEDALDEPAPNGRAGAHTDDLETQITEMQPSDLERLAI